MLKRAKAATLTATTKAEDDDEDDDNEAAALRPMAEDEDECYSTSLAGLQVTTVIRAPYPPADPRARGPCQDRSDHADQDERASTAMITPITTNLLGT
jgi:hypothetical protein